MKQRDFVFNVCLLVFLNLLVKPFWILGVDIGVQNRVGSDIYGLYFSIFSFTMLFNMVLDMGTTNYNNRNIARHSECLSDQLSNLVALRLVLGLVYFVSIFLVSMMIGYRGYHLKLLFWIALNQFLNAFLLYLRSNISAMMMFKTDSVISVLDKLLMIIFCGFLLWGDFTNRQFKIEWFMWCQTLSYVIAISVAAAIVLKKASFKKPMLDFSTAVKIIRKSVPFALVTLLMTCYYRLDSVMLERLLPEDGASLQAGIYAAAFRLLDTLAIVPYLFSVILLPLFSKMLKDRQTVLPIVKTSFLLLLFFSLSASIILFVFREPVINLFYDNNATESVNVFKLIIFGLIPLSLTYLFGTLLTANGNMRSLNIIAAVCLVINIVMNLILIPKFGAEGSAVASLVTQITVCLLQFVFAVRLVNVPLSSFPVIRIVLFAVLLFVSTYLLYNFSDLPVIYGLTAAFCCAILLSFVLKLVDIKDLQFFKRQ